MGDQGKGARRTQAEQDAIRKRIRDDRLARVRAERGRVHELQQPDRGITPHGDMGPALAVDRELVEVRRDALVPVDPEQPDGPQHRRARAQRVWAPERLSRGRNPAVEPHQLQAAERYLEDYLLGEVGAVTGPDGSGVHVPVWNRMHYNERRAQSAANFRAATKASGPLASSILTWCVLGLTSSPDVSPNVDNWAKRANWSNERAVGLLSCALENLALHYGMVEAGPATIAPGRESPTPA